MNQKDFEIISIIASRKTQFYLMTKKKLFSSIGTRYSQMEKTLAAQRLRRVISELDDLLFIGENEKASKTIDPSLSLSQLNLKNEEIVERVLKSISNSK